MNDSNEITARGFLKKLFGFSMASWLSAGISFLITPVLTRLYTPDQVGHVNLFSTYMTFFQTVCVLALDQAFMRFYNETMDGLNKQNLLKYCLKINMGLSTVSAGIILVCHHYFSMQIAGEFIWQIPICLSLVVYCSTFLRMSSISSRMEGNILLYTLQTLFTTFVEKVIFTLTAFYRPTYQTAIASITCGYLCISLIFLFIRRKDLQPSLKKIPKATSVLILKFSIPYLPVLLLSWLNSSLPLFVLKKHVDYTTVGIYTNAVTISNILSIIQTGFSAYWGPFIYENYKNKASQSKIQKLSKCIIFILLFLAISVVLFQDVIYLLLGAKYRSSKLFFPFLMFTPICNCIGDMTGIGIMLSKKSYLNIFTFFGSVSVNFILSSLLVPSMGAVGAGISVAAASITMLTIRSCLGGRYYRVNTSNGPIFLAISLMLGTGITNLLVKTAVYKYTIIAVFLCTLCYVYRYEFFYLLRFVRNELISFRKKIK